MFNPYTGLVGIAFMLSFPIVSVGLRPLIKYAKTLRGAIVLLLSLVLGFVVGGLAGESISGADSIVIIGIVLALGIILAMTRRSSAD